jgi:hypothetical protein
VPVGGRSGVVVAGYRSARVYSVRGRRARLSSLGEGAAVVPAVDGRSVWIKRFASARRCTLRRRGVDGAPIGDERPFPCAATIGAGGELGVIVSRTRVVDPATRRTVARTRWGAVAAAGRRLLLQGPGPALSLLDVRTGRERRFRWPSPLLGLDKVAVDPTGRFVALGFASPAPQALDVWLLDARRETLTHAPGMPASVAIKRTGVAWTDDRRLVLLGVSAGRDVVAVWRPGARRLALKAVRLPPRSGFSASFAPLR